MSGGRPSYHGSEINAGLRIGDDGSAITNGDGDVVARKYGAYILVNAGLTYDATDDVTLSAAVYNLFDEEIDAAEFGTVRQGRSVWFGATARF